VDLSRDRSVSADQASGREAGATDGNTAEPDPARDLRWPWDVVPGPDHQPVVDGKAAVDGKLVVDGKPAVDGKPESDAPTKDLPVGDLADPCATVKCALQNDCCDCAALGGSVPPCSITTCKVSTCTALNVQQPIAACLKGHCLVESDAPASCTADKDCKLVNDCCTCTALPATSTAPACAKMCLISTCVSWGLPAATAHCLGGKCRLVP